MWNDLTYEQLTVAGLTLVSVCLLLGWAATSIAWRQALRGWEDAVWGKCEAEARQAAAESEWQVEHDRRIAAEERARGNVKLLMELRVAQRHERAAVVAAVKAANK